MTSLLFTTSSTLFTLGGKQVGSVTLNRLRLLAAWSFLVLAHLLTGLPLPWNAGGERWFWLSLSGVIGLALGDAFLFQAYLWIGPRLAMLMMALAPVLTALMAWAFFAERLNLWQSVGMLVTLAGIAWVLWERQRAPQPGSEPANRRNYLLGILFGLAAALGQAGGMVTARLGLAGDFSPLTATLMRMTAAALALWLLTFLQGQAGATLKQVAQHPGAARLIVTGAFFGPFIGVTFSLLAIQHTELGVASTLSALAPVFLLPVSYIVFKERFGWRAIAGTLLAICGVAILFLA